MGTDPILSDPQLATVQRPPHISRLRALGRLGQRHVHRQGGNGPGSRAITAHGLDSDGADRHVA